MKRLINKNNYNRIGPGIQKLFFYPFATKFADIIWTFGWI